jgi:hypothetical protein
LDGDGAEHRDVNRVAIRRALTLPCQAVRERDFVLVADRMHDLSIDGLYLPLRRDVLTGESLIVSFQIPGMWIDADATVTRVIHGRRPGDDGPAIGVMFDRLASSTRAALAGYLHGRRVRSERRRELVNPGSVLRAVVDAWQELGRPALSPSLQRR